MSQQNGFEPKSLEECVQSRHSVRFYSDQDVDEQLLNECVALAQRAPSNSNIQNWRLHLARGAAKDRIVAMLSSAAQQAGPKIGPIPDEFQHFRRDMGGKLYGENGYNVRRDDKEKRKQMALRNYKFFDAPVCGVITMSKDLSPMDAMSVGMFVQTFVLALTERGLGTCLQQSVTGYPEVLREAFKISDDQQLLSGIAIGWPGQHQVNDLVMGREEVNASMTLHQE